MFNGHDFVKPKGTIVYNRVANFAGCKEKEPTRAAGDKYHIVENVQTIQPDKTFIPEEAAKPTPKPMQSISADSKSKSTAPREMRENATDSESPVVTLANGENSEKPQESAQDKPSVSNFSTAKIY